MNELTRMQAEIDLFEVIARWVIELNRGVMPTPPPPAAEVAARLRQDRNSPEMQPLLKAANSVTTYVVDRVLIHAHPTEIGHA